MAATKHWAPSRRMRAAASEEVARVEQELARLAAREAELAQELNAVRRARSALDEELVAIQRFAGDVAKARPHDRHLRAVDSAARETAPDDPLAATILHGARIRETAVRLLAQTPNAEQAVHYRTWYELLRQHGFLPAGKDPLATFLTQIGRSPVVQRSTAPGIYSLKLDFPAGARARLETLSEKLRSVSGIPTGAGVDEIAQVQERRAEIEAEIRRAERELAEALRSLGAATGAPEPDAIAGVAAKA